RRQRDRSVLHEISGRDPRRHVQAMRRHAERSPGGSSTTSRTGLLVSINDHSAVGTRVLTLAIKTKLQFANVCNLLAKRVKSPVATDKRRVLKRWRRKGPGGPTGLQNRPGGPCVRRRVRLPPPSAVS